MCVLNLSERGLSDDRLHYLLNTAPPQSIIVLEDVDCALTHDSNKDAYRVCVCVCGVPFCYLFKKVSRSGLLNFTHDYVHRIT